MLYTVVVVMARTITNILQKPDYSLVYTKQLRYYLLETTNLTHITCFAGPQKQLFQISKKNLQKYASKEMQEIYNENTDFVVVRIVDPGHVEGLFLPDIDSTALRIFKKLVYSDCFETYLKMDFTPDQLFNLVDIARTFGTTLFQKGFELLLRRIFQKPRKFFQSPEFYNLTPKNLETLLTEDWIMLEEIDIFKAVCRWVTIRCTKLGLEIKPKNLRNLLDKILFQIRFPWMNLDEMNDVVGPSMILTDEEKSVINHYITKHRMKGIAFKGSEVGFKATERKKTMTSGVWIAVQLMDQTDQSNVKIVDGKEMSRITMQCGPWSAQHYRRLKPLLEAEVTGWAGPVDEDSVIIMTVETFIWKDQAWKSLAITEQENHVPKGLTAHFIFRDLLVREPGSDSVISECLVKCNFKGPTRIPQIATPNPDEISVAKSSSGIVGKGLNCKLLDSRRDKYEEGIKLSHIQYRY